MCAFSCSQKHGEVVEEKMTQLLFSLFCFQQFSILGIQSGVFSSLFDWAADFGGYPELTMMSCMAVKKTFETLDKDVSFAKVRWQRKR